MGTTGQHHVPCGDPWRQVSCRQADAGQPHEGGKEQCSCRAQFKRLNSNHLHVAGGAKRALSGLLHRRCQGGWPLARGLCCPEALRAAGTVSWYSRLAGLEASPCSHHIHDIRSEDHHLVSREIHVLEFHPQLACWCVDLLAVGLESFLRKALLLTALFVGSW